MIFFLIHRGVSVSRLPRLPYSNHRSPFCQGARVIFFFLRHALRHGILRFSCPAGQAQCNRPGLSSQAPKGRKRGLRQIVTNPGKPGNKPGGPNPAIIQGPLAYYRIIIAGIVRPKKIFGKRFLFNLTNVAGMIYQGIWGESLSS